MNKKFLSLALALTLSLSLAACGAKKEAAPAETPAETPAEATEPVVLNVAASATPHAEILEQVVDVLAQQGIDLQIHEYGDYVVPNTAVEEGEEDANYFQHIPYLESFNEKEGTHLVSVGGIHIEPMGIYAGKTWKSCLTAPRSPFPTTPPTKAALCCCWRLRASSSWLTAPTWRPRPATLWKTPRT